jgi:two-component system response regulator AtoC
VKVLVVEDDLSTRKGLEESIKDFGFEARSVGTRKEAAKVLEEFDPRILIVDIHLPDGDGIEVLRLAREKDPDREGVVITGQGSIDNAIEALRAGAWRRKSRPCGRSCRRPGGSETWWGAPSR